MKKIMFNDNYGLTASVLNGTKTMTRRIIDTTPKEPMVAYGTEDEAGYVHLIDGYTIVAASKYRLGEVVAVAQNYQEAINEYKRLGDIARWGKLIANTENGCAGYRNKMFVRPELMPHRIRITDVRVERLQDITDDDCRKEGIDYVGGYSERYYFGCGVANIRLGNSYREAFAALIDKTSGKGTWDSNPWVFVYSFCYKSKESKEDRL